ncbi:keratin, type II cytoskeletal 2 epidermal-like [Melanaphis sacchari]|uniref:keratin, type II cytoskeletal 2 epidermal-like n=1 Tax=Melanaphis sacchari TaxID=742174 RepID=UPI000DC157CC|nr:keratin, type II cytoskeletal 2 epidermal-like [Melanaphis sacchari]
MITAVYRSLALLCITFVCGHVLAYPYNGNNMQWSNPGAGANYHQQPGFGGNVGQQRGYSGGAGFGEGNFGRASAFGGQQRWQSAGYNGQQQGAEAYQSNIFNEPDRYGYDYTIPGATVHFLMYKKKGNRGSGNNNHGVDSSGWDKYY